MGKSKKNNQITAVKSVEKKTSNVCTNCKDSRDGNFCSLCTVAIAKNQVQEKSQNDVSSDEQSDKNKDVYSCPVGTSGNNSIDMVLESDASTSKAVEIENHESSLDDSKLKMSTCEKEGKDHNPTEGYDRNLDFNCEPSTESKLEKNTKEDSFLTSDSEINKSALKSVQTVDSSTKADSNPTQERNAASRMFGEQKPENPAQMSLSYGTSVKATKSDLTDSEQKNLAVSLSTPVNSEYKNSHTNKTNSYADVTKNSVKHQDTTNKQGGYKHQFKENCATQRFDSRLVDLPTTKNSVSIHFVVVMQKKVDNLGIFFGSANLGNWKRPAVKMNLLQFKPAHIYKGVLTCPKYFLTPPIEYKYVIVDEKEKSFTWEYLHFAESHAENNRVLVISKDFMNLLEEGLIFYQVDDIFLFEKKEDNIFSLDEEKQSFLKKGYSYLKSMILKDSMPFSKDIFSSIFNIYVDLFEQHINRSNDYTKKAIFIRSLYTGFYFSYSMKSRNQIVWRKIENHKIIMDFLETSVKQLKGDAQNADFFFSCISLMLVFYDNHNLTEVAPLSFIATVFEKLSLENTDLSYKDFSKMLTSYPKTFLRMVNTALTSLLREWFKRYTSDKSNAHIWCFALLIIHIISEEQPKEVKQENFNTSNCGLPDFINVRSSVCQETFKNLFKIKESLRKDHLLQRGLAYLMGFEHIDDALKNGYFNEHLLVNMMVYHMKSHNYTSNMVNGCQKFVNGLIENFQQRECKRSDIVHALLKMLLVSIDKISIMDDTCAFFCDILNCISKFYKSIDLETDALTKFNEEVQKLVPNIKSNLLSKFNERRCEWYHLNNLVSQLKVIEVLMKFEMMNENVFKELALEILRNKIKKTDKKLLFEAHCQLTISSYREEIQLLFDESFSTSIEELVMNGIDSMLLHRMSSMNPRPLIKFINNKWNTLNSSEDKMFFCLTWKPFRIIMKILGELCTNEEDATVIIVQVESVLQNVFVNITEGDITFAAFQSLCENESALFNLLEIMKCNISDHFKVSYDLRLRQVKNFNRVRGVVNYTLQLCKQLLPNTVEVEELEQRYRSDFSLFSLKNVFNENVLNKKHLDNDLFAEEDSLCVNKEKEFLNKACKYFLVSNSWFESASHMTDCNIMSSFLFQKEVHFTVKNLEDYALIKYDELMKVIIFPTIRNLNIMISNIVSCKVSPSEVISIFSGHNQQCYEELLLITKFLKLHFENADVKNCVEKINCVFLMQKYSGVAKSILEVREKLNLQGEFNAVENMMRPFCEIKELHFIDNSLKNVEAFFEEFLPDSFKIFNAVSSCLQLLHWLKDNLKDPKEVKVFVEIMSIAAGETDYEVDRVKCFEACCLAFSHIIFDLNIKSGFKELFQACKHTEKMMLNDQEIIKKLVDTNHNLEWFKNAKKSQGSVATKSIMEAQIVNRNGHFIIGNQTNTYVDFEEFTLADVIKFKIKNTDSTVKKYTLEEINDLQSRLMLLGGDIGGISAQEKQKEKDYFVEVVEVVTRLGHAFMSLCEAGDISYIYWQKKFHCDIELIRGISLSDLISESEKLEKRFADWKEKIAHFRSTNPVMNYFLVKQCLFLQKHLFTLSQDLKLADQLPAQFYTLLQFFAHDVSLDNIKTAFNLSRNLREEKASIKSNFEKYSPEEIIGFVHTLQEIYEIDKNVAWASIMNCFPYREGKAAIWCTNQDPESEAIKELEKKAKEELEHLIMLNTQSDVIKRSVTKEQVSFLTLEELGRFFEEYKEVSNFQSTQRLIPAFLNKDKPSLIILSRDDILYALLEIYLYQDGVLPSSEEVLICDASVSIEEIELLIMRAMLNKDGLYCLVIDDNLKYEICEKAYDFLQKSMRAGNTSPLIVLCGSENHHSSYFVTALDHYKLKLPYSISKDNVREKLMKCLNCKLSDQKAGINLNGFIYKSLVVKSNDSGMGKSFFVKKCGAQLSSHLEANYQKTMQFSENKNSVVTVSVHGTTVNTNAIVKRLLEFEERPYAIFPRLYHFDITPMVREGLDSFLFNLVVLGSLKTSTGKLWRMNDNDTCIIEITQESYEVSSRGAREMPGFGVVANMLPCVICLSPLEVFQVLQGQEFQKMVWYDTEEHKKPVMQRVCQYLNLYATNKSLLNTFIYNSTRPVMKQKDSLNILLKYCGVKDPCWSEVRNFMHFFNTQLIDCELCAFTSVHCAEDLRGFKVFVISFLLEMAQDFSTRSVSSDNLNNNSEFIIQLKRRWEHSSHPYLFFNQDRVTMTFFGFNVDPSGNLLDPEHGTIIKQSIMSKELYADICRQMHGAKWGSLNTNYKLLTRKEMLEILCCVLGVNSFDPDPSYELTIDNMKKILAIHMRLRCIIPVIMMGETGCGKTKLIKFMCALRAGRSGIQNMLLVKVHGGVTHQDIILRIEQAKSLAKENYYKHKLNTILFFDEANTSDAIGLIKEIMVDKRADGKPLELAECGLEIIAACNPYKKHSINMIKKLESAGLGYHVNAKSTYEKIGDIPLRQLVYRVHPLPKSMIPLVWDFGQLDAETEEAYARQIISRYIFEKKLPDNKQFFELIVHVLAASQAYMRRQKDECSFVSLRDVERALLVTSWFYKRVEIIENKVSNNNTKLQLALIYSLSVCYIAKLEDRDSYREYIAKYFTGQFVLANGAQEIKDKVASLQKKFLSEIELEHNIAQNEALCENVFMMVVCIELRIPLFVVGKPGSSKSLAKSIVQDCMQGNMSKSQLFKNFKQIFMSSYQCSPLSTAEGIINTFRQCSRFQEGKDLETFASVVVLDEVGLAEDSPRMPLKALHPLLEDGTDGSEDLTQDGSSLKNKRVAFIGISNWSLDPAKMNRGIMLYRGQPNLEELVNTARNIFISDTSVFGKIASLFEPLTNGYLKVYEEQNSCDILKKYKKEEFFGLRDFYSLLKLVFCHARKHQDIPSFADIEHAVKRNFSGLQELDTWSIFKSFLPSTLFEAKVEGENMSALHLIADNFADQCPCYEKRRSPETIEKKYCLNSRYLLLMTDDYAALPIIEQLYMKANQKSCVIFGSSFPKDQQFTQVCRDINRIKICMETGTRVVLLNMENLYESLYDTLNQYYVTLGGKSYVDLGIGTHRVKCRVHEDFRLIVIADKVNVYNNFPIPLINRLEKHFLTISNGMTSVQVEMAKKLEKWVVDFSCIKSSKHEFKPSDSFIGYTEDTCASIILKLSQMYDTPDKIFEEGIRVLLKIATPDSLLRVVKTNLKDKFDYYWKIYFVEQFHYSLVAYLQDELSNSDSKFMQVTTFSRLLSPCDKDNLNDELNGLKVEIISIMQFQTEKSFRDCLRLLFNNEKNERKLLIIQANIAQERSKLIACAQYICKEAIEQFKVKKISVLFILQLNYKAKHLDLLSSLSFWECCHIDELRSSSLPPFIKYSGKSLNEILSFDDAKLQMIQLILGCVQMAVRHLSEMKQMTFNEIAQQINIITKLLRTKPGDIQYMFPTTVLNLVQKGLAAEESKMLPDYVSNWVQHEAIEQKYQPAYGTFRQALFCYAEDRIVPVLASILFNIDSFGNLGLLCREPEYTELWLNLFSKTTLISKKVSFKLSNPFFLCKFPFSDRVFREIEDALKNYISPDATNETHDYKQIYDAVSSLPMASLAMGLPNRNVSDYISDLVHLKFPNHCEDFDQGQNSYRVLAFGLVFFVKFVTAARDNHFKALKITKSNSEFKFSDCDIVVLHIVLNTKVTQERLANIASMLIHHPGVGKSIQVAGSPIDVDVLVMDRMLSDIASKRLCPGVIEETKKARLWISNVIEYAMKSTCNEETAETITQSQIKWCKLRICQKFADLVFQSSTCFCNHQVLLLSSLWKKLGTLPNDMLTEEAWNIIEVFLKESLMIDYSSIDEECLIYCCNEVSFILPCCRAIYHQCMHHIILQTSACPKCNTLFKEKDIFQESLERRHMVFEKEEFKKRCISFYAEIVTEFCFSRKDFSRVKMDVIKKILDYVFSANTTKAFSPISDYALDSTPVIRSFLLQQLMQRKYDEVECYLHQHISRLLALADKSQLLDVVNLFIYCIEDKKELEISLLKKETIFNCVFLNNVSEELVEADNIIRSIKPGKLLIDVPLLEGIASIRLFLAISAQILCAWFLKEKNAVEPQLKTALDRFFATLTKFILKHKDSQAHYFLLKQIIRNHGIRSLKEVVMKSEFEWLLSRNEETINSNIISYDKFLVYGEQYKEIRDHLVSNILNEDIYGIIKLKLERKDSFCFLQLAIFKGLSNIPEENVMKFCHILDIQASLSIMTTFSALEQLSAILYHFWVVISAGNPSNRLFLLLATRPQEVYGWFLPAMPSDNLAEVFGLNRVDQTNSFRFYACPRGHPYVITNCGQPTQIYSCLECGLPIGGEKYALLPNNQVVSNRIDTTKPGHCLGAASERTIFAIPQRELTSVSVTLQNLLVHLSMLIATLTGHVMDVVKLVHPDVKADEMQVFLLQHIEKDFALLSNRIAKSDDETNTAVHALLKHLFLSADQDSMLTMDLTTMQSRNQYEKAFDRKFIQPFFQSLDEELLSFKKCLVTDQCINESPLMRQIYELDAEQIKEWSSVSFMSPQLWFYRQSVSVESLKAAVQLRVLAGGAKDISILAKFLEQETVFSMISELPAILELQKFLQHEFNYKLDKQTAVDKSVKQLLSEIPRELKKKADKLFKRFIKTWNQARNLFMEREMRLQPNLVSIKLDEKSNLAFFISTNSDHDSCATLLIDFLAFKQNEFLEECQSINGTKVAQRVPISQLKENDVISYERKRDLLPLVFLHCDYTLGIGKVTRIEHNLEVIQRRLYENVIFGKALIHSEVIQFFYRDDVKSLNFPLLRRSVDQTEIPFPEQKRMLAEMTDIADVSLSLRAVETAIGILAYTGGDSNMFYRRYLTDILRMNERECIMSGKMLSFIRLTHLYSVWLMLTVEQARRIYASKQIPFYINECFTSEDLDKHVVESMKKKLHLIDTNELMNLITEYIVLELPMRKESDESIILSEALQSYEDQRGTQITDAVKHLSEEFLLKHVYLIWKMIASQA